MSINLFDFIQNEIILFENTGETIDLSLKHKIFEPFYTVSKSKNRKEGGFGLGLSIVKNLCHNNECACYLQSSNESKTIFAIEKKVS